MAKDFGKANSANKIKEVAKASKEQANVIQVKMISDENLVNHPRNNEDISDTEDLELSIKQNGFTDPIEVTTFGMEEGKYLIVSGHRRRAAGRKQKITTFPCIVKTFESEADVYNYVLLANSQRDSSKDPLLYCKRYKMHEEYLKESGFKGSIREEIAKRLGLSPQQADRYKQMNEIILTVWDMIKDGKVGMSSVLPMAQFRPDEQEEIVEMFNDCLANGGNLTREACKKMIDGYRDGKKSYLEIAQMDMKDIVSVQTGSAGVSVMSVSTEPGETKERPITNRNDEVNYDYSHREGLLSDQDPYKDERLTEEDKEVIEKAGKRDKAQPAGDEADDKKKNGKKLKTLLGKLEDFMVNEFFSFDDDGEGLDVMVSMSALAKVLFYEMEEIKFNCCIDNKKYESLLCGLIKDLQVYQVRMENGKSSDPVGFDEILDKKTKKKK